MLVTVHVCFHFLVGVKVTVRVELRFVLRRVYSKVGVGCCWWLPSGGTPGCSLLPGTAAVVAVEVVVTMAGPLECLHGRCRLG